MNRRPRTKKRLSAKRPVYKSAVKKSKSGFASLKPRLNLVVIWLLVVINAALISSFIHKIVGSRQTPDIITNTQVPDNPVKIQVLNGCGVSGVANDFADYLKRRNYDVTEIGNTPTFDYKSTVIINRERREKKYVDKFRELIGIPKDLVYPLKSDENEADLTLIIGSDYETLEIYKSLH
ncbi:MAG TPA: LytR C-terminal domain-containing protein [bacterium]|nr:LytR C-terminal domain-containing protein [bacterium]HPN42270.1 LytR C-terminal domain-containing protein [bacterium]